MYEIAIARAEPKLAPYFALPRETTIHLFRHGEARLTTNTKQ
jgi:hypothetical protein